MAERKAVVVTTGQHKGVFFGYLEKHDPKEETVVLADVRMCVYWSADVRGILGLTKTGPSASCKITPSAPKAILADVNAVFFCSDEAAKKWEDGPWAR